MGEGVGRFSAPTATSHKYFVFGFMENIFLTFYNVLGRVYVRLVCAITADTF